MIFLWFRCPLNYRATSHGCRRIEPCLENPCLNRGICELTPGGDSYQCICPSGFVGANCEWTTNDSMTYPLSNSLMLFVSLLSFLFMFLLISLIICFGFHQKRRKSAKKHKKSSTNPVDSESDLIAKAYFTDKSGNFNNEMSCKIENSLGIIQDMREIPSFKRDCNVLGRKLNEAEVSKLLKGNIFKVSLLPIFVLDLFFFRPTLFIFQSGFIFFRS